MTVNELVFCDTTTPIDDLVVQVIKNMPTLSASEVEVVDAAKAVDGEVWSPQLPAYRAWKVQDAVEGTDGDLLVVGSLGMGISDAEREALVARAKREQPTEQKAAALVSAYSPADVRGAVEVRQDVDGYALVGIDLRRFAAVVGCNEGLVVAVPAYVDGVPVVRIAAEAFSRRFVQGVGVRLLVVPDTVMRIAANTFLTLSAGHIHLGCGVEKVGEQPCDLAGVSPRLRRREYSVNVRNEHYVAHEGSLFSEKGARLLFLASPYARHFELPGSVEHIGSAAFAAGCEPPSMVGCSSALRQVDSKVWDAAVWRCPKQAPAYRVLALRGVRLAGPDAVEVGSCWYDFDERGAVLVAGPPAPSTASKRFAAAAAVRAAAARGQGEQLDVLLSDGATAISGAPGAPDSPDEYLALPQVVSDVALVRIGAGALPHAPASLVVADTVTFVETGNTCRGTKRLVLPEGLRRIGAHCFCSRILEGPVSIPASVCSLGEGSFEYAVCRLEHTGSIVHVSADQLLNCFLAEPLDGIPFDFARYDVLLRGGKNLPDRLGAVLHRLTVPYRLAADTRDALVAYLRNCERDAQERVAQEGDREMVEALVKAGFIDERTFDRQIELLRRGNRTDCVAYLMQWHRGQMKPSVAKDRFAL